MDEFDTDKVTENDKKQIINQVHRYSLLKISGLIFFILFIFIVQSFRWSGEKGAQKAHENFISYFSEKRFAKCSNSISDDYSDQWDFNNDEIALALRDYAKHFFLSFQANWQNNSIRKTSETYQITGNLKINGTGNQITEMIIKETRTHLLDPFTFHWKKSGFLPWSWKLIRIEHSKLEVPSGYVPGKSFNSLRW